MADHASVVRVLKGVPLQQSYSDTLTFVSVSEQTNYFVSKQVKAFTDLQYIKSGPFHLPDQVGEYRNCNYLMYQNPDVPGKWFYAFITGVEFLANGTTLINYADDLIQTYWFDFNIKQCMVQREHVNDDRIGVHIKDEGLAYGYYITNSFQTQLFRDWWLIVVSAVELKGEYAPSQGNAYNDLYSGLLYYVYSPDDYTRELASVLAGLAEQGKSDAIVAMYMVPFALIPDGQISTTELETNYTRYRHLITAPNTGTLDGYTPRNKKLLTYPYRALKLSNRCGSATTLMYEKFTSGNALSVQGSLMPNGRMLLTPLSYDGRNENFEYGINLGEYPQCSWLKDVYSNWLATQSVRWGYEEERREITGAFSMGNAVAGTALGVAFGDMNSVGRGMGTMVQTAVHGIKDAELAASEMAEEKEVHQMIPPAVRGQIGNESTIQVINEYGFQLEEITITSEFAKSIDGYFDMFGYRVDMVKTPNITGRQSWNYVKTIGAVVAGNVPIAASTLFQGLLNRGIRFWHTPDIGNYSLSNNPV